MASRSRRDFVKASLLGAAGVVGLRLPASARPTESNGSLEEYKEFLEKYRLPELPTATPGAPTAHNILGPYHRKGAPFRGKVTPPFAPGQVLLVQGRVWSWDTKQPLGGVTVDIWQANHEGRYDHEGPENEARRGYYGYRIRIVTDESGWYEYETIHPAPYKPGPNAENSRPSHIHYRIHHPGHRELITQLYFEGDKYNATDGAFLPQLAVKVKKEMVRGQSLETCVFDLILEAERIA